MLDLAGRIKALRKEQELSQTQLAKLVGVTQSAIAQIETGMTRNIKAPTLLRLSAALKASPYYLMTGKGDRGGEQVSDDTPFELLKLYELMPDDHKSALLAAAKALAIRQK